MTTNPRATQRLRIASGLLKLKPGADVMAKINALNPEQRDSLKSCTDWVEDYENSEASA